MNMDAFRSFISFLKIFFYWSIVDLQCCKSKLQWGGFPDGSAVKSDFSAGDAGLIPGWEIPWGRKWQPTPVFLPGKSYGQRSLVGYSPWVAEWLSMHACITSHQSEWSSSKNLQIINAGNRPLIHCWWECKLMQPLWCIFISNSSKTETYQNVH